MEIITYNLQYQMIYFYQTDQKINPKFIPCSICSIYFIFRDNKSNFVWAALKCTLRRRNKKAWEHMIVLLKAKSFPQLLLHKSWHNAKIRILLVLRDERRGRFESKKLVGYHQLGIPVGSNSEVIYCRVGNGFFAANITSIYRS